MAKIGIYGGSFNPPHLGHILAAREFQRALDLDLMLFVPAAQPPHKDLAPDSPDARTRLELVKLAVRDLPWARVEDLELRREGASYTVDTVKQLRADYPNDELFLCMGTDMFQSFETWYHPKKICSMAKVVMAHREDPDSEAIEACSLYARQLSEKYGIEILIYRDATDVQPWDYDLEYEYLAPVIWQELERLEAWLSHYPEGFLKILLQSFPDIRIGIVRSITGSPESGSLDTADGIQFWEDQTSYIILATGEESERVLYHELFHLIDTVVLTYSTAYDLWESLNPEDFSYDYDYLKNETRDGSRWLQPGQECFIDRYSMSYPKEDRARIMEYAMSPGNADRFHSAVMQMKLRKLCIGIREAFDLKYSSEIFLWEQYLDLPLNHPEA